MSPFLLSLLFALGVSAWIYNKVQHRNGGIAQQSLIAAGAVGLVALVIFYTLFVTFVPN